LFAFSNSFSTEDSDYWIDNEEDARAFEIKKRKLDDAGGRPLHHTRQTGKTAAEDSSSAGQHVRTKVIQPRGPHPSQKGKGAHRGLVDVEKEQEIMENLGSAHINTWRNLRLANPYCFHERQYTGSDKKFWTDSQRAMWDDYYDALMAGMLLIIIMARQLGKSKKKV
jgi:hypothetical protein